jgi:hypothetical protein
MNPMLATTWYVFGVKTPYDYPTEFVHFFVYWISPCLAAVLASVLYVVYAGGTIFGCKLPVGPLKKSAASVTSTKSAAKKLKKK